MAADGGDNPGQDSIFLAAIYFARVRNFSKYPVFNHSPLHTPIDPQEKGRLHSSQISDLATETETERERDGNREGDRQEGGRGRTLLYAVYESTDESYSGTMCVGISFIRWSPKGWGVGSRGHAPPIESNRVILPGCFTCSEAVLVWQVSCGARNEGLRFARTRGSSVRNNDRTSRRVIRHGSRKDEHCPVHMSCDAKKFTGNLQFPGKSKGGRGSSLVGAKN